jgi:hypothetical protein
MRLLARENILLNNRRGRKLRETSKFEVTFENLRAILQSTIRAGQFLLLAEYKGHIRVLQRNKPLGRPRRKRGTWLELCTEVNLRQTGVNGDILWILC